MSLTGPLCEPEILGTLNMDCACCICFQPPLPQDAMMVTPCNHLFCRGCLEQAMSKKAECPVDRAVIDGQTNRVEVANAEALALVCAVAVQCSARRRGCAWEGTWGEWIQSNHAAMCEYRTEAEVVCTIPGCTVNDGSAVLGPPSTHEQEHLYAHIKLLSHTVRALEDQNRTMRWEMDQLKERLYSAQNDISDWQHASRRERDAADAAEQRFQQQLENLTQNTRILYPAFVVRGVSDAVPAMDLPPGCRLWDPLCCSRSSDVNGAILTHSGTVKGWATAFAQRGVTVRRDLGRVVGRIRFQLRSTECASAIPSSVIMVGLAIHRPSIVTLSSTQHVGALAGCWAYQGSGFVWDGNSRSCGQLMPSSNGVDQSAASFGPGDTITLSIESTKDGCSVVVSKDEHDGGGATRTTEIGVGSTIPFGQIEEVVLFPVASLGTPNCCVELV